MHRPASRPRIAPRRLLPEWAPQSAILLAWPHDHSDWAATLPAIEALYLDLVEEIGRRQRVVVICRDPIHRWQVRRALRERGLDPGCVVFALAETQDSWVRDYGPLGVREPGRTLLVDCVFNGWGMRYPATRDDAVNRTLSRQGVFGDTPMVHYPRVLEGGALDSDGAGTALATRRSVLAANRNPGIGRGTLERELARVLGISRMLWLEHGALEGDDTDGHVDNLARFCDPQTIAYCACGTPRDLHFRPLRALASELCALRDNRDRPYRLVPLPLPAPITDPTGRRLPASYVNFLILNAAVLVPCFDDPNDALAIARLQRVFPTRKVTGIDCRAAIQQYGGLHCLTMQLPEAISLCHSHTKV